MFRLRSRRGNMIAFMLGTMMVMTVLILFGLWYTQHTLNGTSHRSAIDSAALAAASSLSRIVVNTPEFGYVSLIGGGPTSSATKAGDNYFQRVHGINEIMGTARVDACIAQAVGEPCLKKLAEKDADAAKSAANQLFAELNAACAPTGFGKDIDGVKVYPYKDAQSLYLNNPTLSSAYVPDSLELKLGGLSKGIATAIPVPASKSLTTGADVIGNRYLSDHDTVINGKHYVFAAVGDQPSLVKISDWTETVSGVDYQMPAVVRVTAKQTFKEQGRVEEQTYQACAAPGGAQHATAAGAFVISAPDGNMSEVSTPGGLFGGTFASSISGVPLMPIDGDFPTDLTSKMVPAFCDDSSVLPGNRFGPQPWANPNKPAGNEMAMCCWYDWVRQAGSRVDVDSMLAMLNQTLDTPDPEQTPWKAVDALGINLNVGSVPTGVMHIFKINPANGQYTYTHKNVQPEPYFVSHLGQLYAEKLDVDSGTPKDKWQGLGLGLLPGTLPIVAAGFDDLAAGSIARILSVTDKWDIYYRDYCRNLGNTNGGKHAGEPMVTNQITWQRDYGSGGNAAGTGPTRPPGHKGLPPVLSEALDGFFSTTIPGYNPLFEKGQQGVASGEARPSYFKDGLDSMITLRRQVKTWSLLNPLTIYTGYKGVMN